MLRPKKPAKVSQRRRPRRALPRALPPRRQEAPLQPCLPPRVSVRPAVVLVHLARRTTAGRLPKEAIQRASSAFENSHPADAWTRVRYQVSCWGVATWPPGHPARQLPLRWWPWRLQVTAAESGSSEPTGPPRAPLLSPRGAAAASPYSSPALSPASSCLLKCIVRRARR